MSNFKVTILGASGSSAFNNTKRLKHGTNTSCVLIEAGETNIIWDMGTGIIHLSSSEYINKVKSAHILLSHLHYDHIEGATYFKQLFDKNCKFNIYSAKHGDCSLKENLTKYLSNPFSPIELEFFKADCGFFNINCGDSFYIDKNIRIDTISLSHPGGSTGYKINFDDKSVAFVLDYEHNDDMKNSVEAFCMNVDVLIYDSHFTQEEYESGSYLGWGHSTHIEGAILAKKVNAKKLILSHHATWRTDDELDTLEKEVNKIFQNAVMAKENLKIII